MDCSAAGCAQKDAVCGEPGDDAFAFDVGIFKTNAAGCVSGEVFGHHCGECVAALKDLVGPTAVHEDVGGKGFCEGCGVVMVVGGLIFCEEVDDLVFGLRGERHCVLILLVRMVDGFFAVCLSHHV